MKKLSLLCVSLCTIFTLQAQESIKIPEKPSGLGQRSYQSTVEILHEVNAKGYVNYASYLQAALSYSALLQPEEVVLTFLDKAMCEDAEKTCEMLLFMEEKQWMIPEQVSNKNFEKYVEHCYCSGS